MSKQLSDAKQNGRSTSQVSIYDYPEYLNPFYEDDNHKRLRFWKIGTLKRQKSGRSNSFSLDGLKDMWAFKSFRLKKKSSTLGINKTSESPPTLRREIEPSQSYNSGTALRHTVNIGLGNNFDRNTPYRSSLQDVHNQANRYDNNNTSLGFNRNDRYRNTMQNAGGGFQTTPRSLNRYGGGAGMNNTTIGFATTPTPSQRFGNSTRQITRGSSQTSLNSTNPFDEEEDDGDTMSTIGSIADGSESVRRTGRKKRRAPAPPTPSSSIMSKSPSTMSNNNNNNNNNLKEQPLAASSPSATIRNNNSQNSIIKNQELIRETTLIDRRRTSPLRNNDDDDDRQNENNEIHNLTAEIESFVKIADTDTEQLTNTKITIVDDDKPIAAERKIKEIDKNNNTIATDLSSSESPDRIITSTNTRTITIEHRKSPENNEEYSDNTRENSPDSNNINKNNNNNNNNNNNINNNKDNNNGDVQSRISPDKLVNLDDQNHSDKNMKKSPIKIIIRRATEEDVMIDMKQQESVQSTTSSPPSKSNSTETSSINDLPNKTVQTGETTTTTTSTVIQVDQVKPELPVEVIIKSENQEKPYTTKKRSPPPAIPNGKLSKKNDDIREPAVATDMLKITESNDDLTKIDCSPTSSTSIGTTTTTTITTTTITNPPTCSITNLEYAAEKYRIRYVPLKNFSPEPLRRDRYSSNTKENGFHYVEQQMEKYTNDSKESSPQPIAPERRRSVKDIIASINKCQSLLKINQQPQQSSTENGIMNDKRFTSLDTINTNTTSNTTKPQSLTFESSQVTTPSNESITRNINQLNESEREIKRLISEMEEQHSPTSTKAAASASAMDIDSLPLMVEKFDEYNKNNGNNGINNDNNELFKKCTVQKREKNYSKQSDMDCDEYNIDQMRIKTNPSSHLEWNPLPKPRRSRNSNEFGKI